MGTRLAALLAPTRREGALDVLRAWRWTSPRRTATCCARRRALYRDEDDQGERADVMERLLAVEEGDAAAALSQDLAALRAAMDDEEGVERALVLGFRARPGDDALRAALEQRFTAPRRRGRARGPLRDLGRRAAGPQRAVRGLPQGRGAAARRAGGPRGGGGAPRAGARGAAGGPRAARRARAHALDGGAAPDAIAAVTEAIEDRVGGDPAAYVDLLRLRAALRGAAGDDAAAVD
jgi:hypothetical protein